ncbi:helix-turn-helix domain-containing protein [Actinoplanes sp. NPDC051633]|uniref:helix-turn-helix domain-containing protein n=1 Tax=Actinoplanes sp. NPDC051633 TaxID=3155670 RepID=UPI003442285C
MPGILHARAAAGQFAYAELPVAPGLEPFAEHYWRVRWDLTGRPPYEQWVLPYPSVNITFKADRCRVAGVPRGRFSETLTGTGRVFGIRFRPGGFRPFTARPVAELTARFVPVAEFFGEPGVTLAEAVLAAGDEDAAAVLDAFLLGFEPRRDADGDVVADAVRRVAVEPGLTRADQLADATGVGLRRLQRLFREHVGVGPKWLIRRYRLHEAAARAATGVRLDLVCLAAELGYSDQAHLTRDFTALIGTPPARYARDQR